MLLLIKLILLNLLTATTCYWMCHENNKPPCYPQEKTCGCFLEYYDCCASLTPRCISNVVLNAVAGISYSTGEMVYFKLGKNEDGSVRSTVEKTHVSEERDLNFIAKVGFIKQEESFKNLSIKTFNDWNLYEESRHIVEKTQQEICHWLRIMHDLKKKVFFDMDFTPRNITVPFANNGNKVWDEEIVFQFIFYNKRCGYRVDTDIFYHRISSEYLMGMREGAAIDVSRMYHGLGWDDLRKGGEGLKNIYV